MWGYKEYPLEKIHFRPVWGNIFLKSNSSIYYSISKGGREGFVRSWSYFGEGNGNPLQYSCLENPWTEKPGRLQSMGLRRVEHDWATSFSLLLSCIGEENGNHSSVLAWRIPGMAESGGLPFMRSHRVGNDWSNLAAAADLTLLQANSLLCLWCYQ